MSGSNSTTAQAAAGAQAAAVPALTHSKTTVASAGLEALSYTRVLERGFALVSDAAGHPITAASAIKPDESQSTLRDGTDIHDFVGLRNYVAGPRREDLLHTLARKLTGYALSRTVLPSDRALVDEVSKTMIAGGRWSDALLVIVRSEPFRCIRPATGTLKSAENGTK